MGKIRIKTLGSDEAEKKEKKKQEARAQAKKAKEQFVQAPAEEKKAEVTVSEKPNEGITEDASQKTDKKPAKKETVKRQKHGTSYVAIAQLVEKNKIYTLNDALSILPKLKRAKFDESVELHINTTQSGISGNVILPHGTGREVRIIIADASSDAKAVDDLIKKIESGTIDFDILIATPDSMSKLAKVARVLGPRGLMPNPKNGTVTPKPAEAAKKYQGGQVNYKTESKFPVLHLTVGKVSFGDKKLAENIKAFLHAVDTKNIKDITLKSTMSPGIKIDTSSL
jgi:large subunit ribosomal protein L1